MTLYNEQYARAKRYFHRFKALNDGSDHDEHIEFRLDDVYAFFQHCYHLKDWIKNDPACRGWSSVEAAINASPDLCVCADLCNGSKHLNLTSSRSGGNPTIGNKIIQLKITDGLAGHERVEIAVKIEVVDGSRKLDAFQIAERSMNAWETYLKSNGATI